MRKLLIKISSVECFRDKYYVNVYNMTIVYHCISETAGNSNSNRCSILLFCFSNSISN